MRTVRELQEQFANNFAKNKRTIMNTGYPNSLRTLLEQSFANRLFANTDPWNIRDSLHSSGAVCVPGSGSAHRSAGAQQSRALAGTCTKKNVLRFGISLHTRRHTSSTNTHLIRIRDTDHKSKVKTAIKNTDDPLSFPRKLNQLRTETADAVPARTRYLLRGNTPECEITSNRRYVFTAA